MKTPKPGYPVNAGQKFLNPDSLQLFVIRAKQVFNHKAKTSFQKKQKQKLMQGDAGLIPPYVWDKMTWQDALQYLRNIRQKPYHLEVKFDGDKYVKAALSTVCTKVVQKAKTTLQSRQI